jgi:hypothetical protein
MAGYAGTPRKNNNEIYLYPSDICFSQEYCKYKLGVCFKILPNQNRNL